MAKKKKPIIPKKKKNKAIKRRKNLKKACEKKLKPKSFRASKHTDKTCPKKIGQAALPLPVPAKVDPEKLLRKLMEKAFGARFCYGSRNFAYPAEF